MEITGYDTYELSPRWLFLKLEASDGSVGWGEPIVEGQVATVQQAVEGFVDQLLGSDPRRIEDAWQAMYRGEFYRGGPILMSAIAGIDQALWDLKGRHYGIPAHELLGGRCRDRLRVFRWAGGDDPKVVAEEAKRHVDAGYRVLKIDATGRMTYVVTPEAVEAVLDRVSEVREAIGDDVLLGLDFRGRVSPPMADRLLSRLDRFDLLFVEEPVLPEYNDRLPNLAAGTSTPIATGERLYSRWQFRKLLESGGVDLLQPNVSHAGGLTETRKIAALAASYGVAIAPNCPTGPLTLGASMQLGACTPNYFLQDHGYDVQPTRGSMFNEYVANDGIFEIDDGFVDVPDGPGLGIEIDEDAVREHDGENIGWSSPIWRHDDGSIADW